MNVAVVIDADHTGKGFKVKLQILFSNKFHEPIRFQIEPCQILLPAYSSQEIQLQYCPSREKECSDECILQIRSQVSCMFGNSTAQSRLGHSFEEGSREASLESASSSSVSFRWVSQSTNSLGSRKWRLLEKFAQESQEIKVYWCLRCFTSSFCW